MRHYGTLLLAVFGLSLFAASQTADELVQKNIEAKGGLEKIKAIKTVRVTGRLVAGRFYRYRRPGKYAPKSGSRDLFPARHDASAGLRWRNRLADSAFR